ncbi:hypothetical protein QQS21_004612 [Conoideocrella luteorostrata]|uniref:Protein SERAC1 n=1 Tax=Conoideocrella luteorostrata TaxID=1105319 RepID=A0AAJ0FVA9_9HYPO|nr:hypothetical protein QQS21_004612 [Conoideocrella luteorostrata]
MTWIWTLCGVATLVVVMLTNLIILFVVARHRRGDKPRSGKLRVLLDPADAEFVIVAVHGLGANPKYTWTRASHNGSAEQESTSSSSRVHLLRDLLGPDFPQARILCFEYDCDWLINASAKTSWEIGRSLLDQLKAENLHRPLPIVFIGHSLGGIVIKESDEVFNTTSGIIFLGTPHHGSSASTAAAVLAFVTSFVGSDATLPLSLRSDRNELSNLADTFQKRLFSKQSRHKKFPVIAFYETKRTCVFRWLPLGKVVSRNSATVHADEVHAVDTDHSGLNKYTGRDELYEQLKTAVNSVITPSLIKQADQKVKECYYNQRLRVERLSGESLSMDQCYINLAIVEHNRQTSSQTIRAKATASPFSLFSRQKVETPDKEDQIDLATIFNERKTSDGRLIQPRRILIRGRAGVGKTTLCKKIIKEFYDGKWSDWTKLFHRVLWVPLRNLKLDERQIPGYGFKHLFGHEYFSQAENKSDLEKALFNELKSNPNKTLFLLDGLDEVSQDLRGAEGTAFFLNFLLSQPNAIITSRPSGSIGGLNPLDLELETTGFYPEQVQMYIERAFPDLDTGEISSEKVKQVRQFLDNHPLVQTLVRIPIQLDALCYTWDILDQGTMPDTMTGIYKSIEQNLWKKDAERLYKEYNGKPVKSTNIGSQNPQFLVDNEIRFLEGLAFTGIYNKVIEFFPKHQNEVQKQFAPANLLLEFTLPFLSFLRTSDPPCINLRSYHFIHLTFQEYFAARYFVRQWKANQNLLCHNFGVTAPDEVNARIFLRKNKYSEQYNLMWRFVSGLLADEKEQVTDLFNTIEDQPRDLLGPTHQRLVMHCLNEVDFLGQLPIRSKLEQRLPEWILFECHLTGTSTFARDTECPEKCIIAALKTNSATEKILTAMQYRRAQLSDEMIAIIKGLLQDKEEKIQFAAANALGGQSHLPEAAIIGLIELLRDKEESARSGAAYALGEQSHLPEAAIPLITKLLHSKGEGARSCAKFLQSKSELMNQMLGSVGLLSKSEQPSKTMSPALREPKFLGFLLQMLLHCCFNKQLSLYVDDFGDTRSCILNQSSDLRSAHLQGGNLEHNLYNGLCEGRQLCNTHGFKLWDGVGDSPDDIL